MDLSNTVLLAYRNRKNSLSTFLDSMSLAAEKATQKPTIIVCSLSSDNDSVNLFKEWKSKKASLINAKWIEVDYSGQFNKCKALNTCLKFSTSKFVTMIDVDSIVLPNFLESIENFYKSHDHRIKMCHRVRYFQNMSFTTDHAKVMRHSKRYRMAREWYFYHNAFQKIDDISLRQQTGDLFAKNALGNSHFSASREMVVEMGGWNIKFEGWGWEDCEFNGRWWQNFKNGFMITSHNHFIMHRRSHYEKDWNPKDDEHKNRDLYRSLLKDGFPKPDQGSGWYFTSDSHKFHNE